MGLWGNRCVVILQCQSVSEGARNFSREDFFGPESVI